MSQSEYSVFTFGCGQPNAGKYVKIYGTYEQARKKMFARYGRRWAFQYSADEWADWVIRANHFGIPVETELEVIE